MPNDDVVAFKGVELGQESASGLAVRVKIKGEWKWVPLSQVDYMKRDKASKDNDEIHIKRWFAEKEGLES